METDKRPEEYKKVKCSTAFYMKPDICNDCGLKAEKIEKDKEYVQYQPQKTKYNGWKCDMHEHKKQGSLF